MKLLLPIDNSDYSAEAIKEVAKRPWPPKTIVRVVSVVEPVPPPAAELDQTVVAGQRRIVSCQPGSLFG